MYLNSLYDVTSNLEAGHGRFDIILKSKQPHLRCHVVIEFKEGEDLEKEKNEALNQIFERDYIATLSGDILCIGVAFKKKKVEVISKYISK